ncbi:hypothetical protein L1267_23445 [Pseudoalteromonas sp. OFAV1]|uniref:hypothetical protein n=1 Tax=Pseudoalteromonas sp. OFAV1 TaxID=2908892 RepID=UPI001F38E19A|nr:hypothetical protein [Pseudoalteromonas sp. OFAV1]MCF2903327.1 hypothetical protein [Pseudoalteromonas sp. OFAV1]
MSELSKNIINNISIEDAQQLKVGQWVWVKADEFYRKSLPAFHDLSRDAWFGCITHIGSNYIQVEEPDSRQGYNSVRVHFDDINKQVSLEGNPDAIISNSIGHYKGETVSIIGQINSLVSELGLTNKIASNSSVSTSTGLSTIINHGAVDALKNELMEARDVKLPELENKLKSANEGLAKWSMAASKGLSISALQFKNMQNIAEERIQNISLYTGISEDIVQIQDGNPATADDKLHVFQRKLYMDETSLLDYRSGGLELSNIASFDQWLCRSENLERILSFPRSMVVFQVRRNDKERPVRKILDSFFNDLEAKQDKLTFIYIRNGEKVHRISTELSFDDLVFPTGIVGLAEPAVAKRFGRSIEKIITKREYESLLDKYNEQARLHKKWFEDNPLDEWLNADSSRLESQYRLSNPVKV